eukprot:2693341-Rhodomonas_salina.4
MPTSSGNCAPGAVWLWSATSPSCILSRAKGAGARHGAPTTHRDFRSESTRRTVEDRQEVPRGPEHDVPGSGRADAGTPY